MEGNFARHRKRNIVFFIIIVIVLLGKLFSSSSSTQQKQSRSAPQTSTGTASTDDSRFQCDGRIYCSQMTSCEEAEFFLEHCPGVKMDGDGDGVPCERQWCR